jgi:hypothetical protein
MMQRSLWLAAALVLAACNDPEGPTPESGQVLLEIEYSNYAWVPTFGGFFVEGSGDIYSYDRNGQPFDNDDDVLTETELQSKLAPNRILVATRDSQEVATIAARITQVVPDQLSLPVSRCADAGALTYRAYRFNSATRTYRPILLRTEGDMAQENLSPAAQQLVAYVQSLNLHSGMSMCAP